MKPCSPTQTSSIRRGSTILRSSRSSSPTIAIFNSATDLTSALYASLRPFTDSLDGLRPIGPLLLVFCHQGERFGNMVIKMLLALVLRSCEVDLVGGELPEADHRKQNATPAPGTQ